MVSITRAQHTTSQDDHIKATLNDFIIALEIIDGCKRCKSRFAELRK